MALIANKNRDTASIPMGHNSEGGIVSEIQSLKSAIDALGQSISLWNNLMIWGFSLAAFFTVCGIAATKMVVFRTEQQSTKQSFLDAAQDRQLKSDLGDKDVKIAEAQRGAGEAKEHAASLEADNLDLRRAMQPRRLNPIRI